MTNKVGAGTIKEVSGRSLEDILYMDMMARELLTRPRPPKPNVPTHFNGKLIKDLSDSERQDFYFSMQPESTKAAMIAQKERDPEDDANWANRPLPLNWKAVPEADMDTPEGRDLAVAKRALDPNEVDLVKQNKVGRNTLGDSEDSGTSKETRKRSIEAFTYSRPYEPTDNELTKLGAIKPLKNVAIPDESRPEKPKKRSFWSWPFGDKSEEKKIVTKVGFTKGGLRITTWEKDENSH